MEQPPLLLNSITDADASARGRVVVSGSHGGVYPAAIASRLGIRSVIFHDAGIGYEGSGVAGIRALDACGMAAAAVDSMSAEIGSASDTLTRGIISFANENARALGVRAGMVAEASVRLLATAPMPSAQLDEVREGRWDEHLPGHCSDILCVDSASLVQVGDLGRIIITGSHGGLIGGDPKRALKASAQLAVFNDAGGGWNAIGTSRLPALELQGIAALTVSHESCRIGDAASALNTGVISALNRRAQKMGASVNTPLAEFLVSGILPR